jgi:hypothetical protein
MPAGARAGKAGPAGSHRLLVGDLADPEAVRALAAQIRRDGDQLHALVHTAATLTQDRQSNRANHELMFATNVLGRFLLTHHLLPHRPGTPGAGRSGVCRPRPGIAVEPRLVPGVPLSGVVTVAPLRSASARGIRVELVLQEHVLHGPRLTDDPARNPAHEDKYADTVVASLPLADHVRLEASRPLRFEFTVPVPPRLPAPTMRMPNFTLRWMLRGVVDRQLHRDLCVAVELQAVTTPQ